MATLRQYFETDFNVIKIKIFLSCEGEEIIGMLLLDPPANAGYTSWYIPGSDRTHDYFVSFLKLVQHGSHVNFAHEFRLPSAKEFHGSLKIHNVDPFRVDYQLFGDPIMRSALELAGTRRTFIYSETKISDGEIIKLQEAADTLGHKLQFRDDKYVQARLKLESPLAFICHDSRDKEKVARPIATELQRFLCPVWYDEFSLKVGDHLRESIEKGLRECKKCILVLSPNFFANSGWTKKEFDSIFTREIMEEKKLILPIWHGVTKQQVYEYSPSLLDVKGLDWDFLGADEVCQQLYSAIIN